MPTDTASVQVTAAIVPTIAQVPQGHYLLSHRRGRAGDRVTREACGGGPEDCGSRAGRARLSSLT